MKQFKTLLFAAALFIGATSFSNAQSKVAHINTQDLVSSMPDMKAAQSQMDQLGKTYEAEIKELATALQNKMKQYDAEATTKTDEENANRLQEVQGMEQNIRQYQANAQKDMQQKELDLLKPITEKAKAAILNLKPNIDTIHPVIVVPILAPMITPIDCVRVKRPAFTKLTTMTVVAEEDWMIVVMAKPVKTATKRLDVI